MTWLEFLQMGGYGLYVWSAYALTVAAMGAEILLLVLRRRRALRDEAIDRSGSEGSAYR